MSRPKGSAELIEARRRQSGVFTEARKSGRFPVNSSEHPLSFQRLAGS